MARPRRTANGSLKDELYQHPHRFEFFQAVRLLRLLRMRERGEDAARDLGEDSAPLQECVHLKGDLSHRFPTGEVTSIEIDGKDGIPVLSVAAMGLYGAQGVLPLHDTQRLIDSRRDAKAETSFLDLFNHRILSLFYRAWAKHYLPLNYEQSFRQFPYDRNDYNKLDVVSSSLLSIAGGGLQSLRNRLDFADTNLIYFAAHFSRCPKSASSLAQMIRAIFEVPVRITHFIGQWLFLDENSRSEMPSPAMTIGQNAELGKGFILGDRVWDIGGKFRVTVGPLKYSEMLGLCPWEPSLRRLFQLVKSYVGQHLEFDVQLELEGSEIPSLELGGLHALGVNCWLVSNRPLHNSDDAIFRYVDVNRPTNS
jgi:type VI secretion system protein ImpH